MHLHEYQAKELFRTFDIPVPEGRVIRKRSELSPIIDELGLPLVVKAQVLAGGRGKGGGVRLVQTADEANDATTAILGMELVTAQTGGQGKTVHSVLVEQGLNIARELYLSLLIDRDRAEIVIITSLDGGMAIEEVAASTPERIIRIRINPLIGLQGYHLRQLAFGLKLSSQLGKEMATLVRKLYRLFVECDCSQLEINPLVVTTEEQLSAVDAKVEIDSSSLYRHPELAALQDPDDQDPLEAEARDIGLNYIRLEGTIGTIVNGAGLAMATMDLIKQAGAEPANFLDVGGGASSEMIEKGFRILLSDQQVTGIFINIFGGILRCDVLARGVVKAAQKTGLNLPVIVRMEGTNVDEGRRILTESGLALTTVSTLNDAAHELAALRDLR
ncbi:MAG: ADP-forming succinate--CoA ligase subunit beta [Desulfobulbaceae bacterium]|uniref:Succinate--CoA ligase [ADP-forming] subunit beta n=1 Tax=Candidatus Desulfatifera sulfidica TaxID=2841691 RepID=A0A8J6N730_9BACT|nr:ADP-forming succinate--CoA ligase subunit beta [Candidatus Desulfatifera sulfidica]